MNRDYQPYAAAFGLLTCVLMIAAMVTDSGLLFWPGLLCAFACMVAVVLDAVFNTVDDESETES